MDGAYICGHLLAGVAVPPCRRLRQHAMLIDQAQRQAIKFRFDCIVNIVASQTFADATVKCFDFLARKRIVERQHRHAMSHLRKVSGGFRAYALGG